MAMSLCKLFSLAGSPLLGRQCAEPHEFLRSFEHGKHVNFYQPEKQGVRIVRVLHERMLTQMHLM
jgi:toxin ParE1/3/4